MTERTRAHVWVSGRVQGVYFRASTESKADEEQIDGWVRNLADGRVEAVFEGESDAIERMIEWCHTGSDRARVEDVSVEFEPPQGIDGFSVRY